jgi:hypothetical protein
MAQQIGTTRIAEKSLGTRTSMNTDFGVIAFVERHQFGQRPYWTVDVVCNGINDSHEQFSTRGAALEAFEAL